MQHDSRLDPESLRLGVDLGGTKIEVIALDVHGRERSRIRRATPQGNYDATVREVAAAVDAVESDLGHRGTVGVGIPGTVSQASGLIKNANSTWLIGRPFDRDLSQALQRPVRIQNDANCFAVSEAVDGAGRDASLVFGVILGTGVGGGLVLDRQIVDGPMGITGEWGHVPLPWPEADEWPGPLCYCGRKGCIETFLSGPGMAARYAERIGAPVSADAQAIATAAERGDPAAAAYMATYCDRLARGLSCVINIVDPEVIVLGGGLSKLAMLYEEVPARLPRYVFSDRVDTRILAPRHGDSSGVRGAAWLWPAAPAAAVSG